MRGNNGERKLISFFQPKSPISEAYRTLRTNIQYASIAKDLKSLMVTSSGPEEGKSTTITNLAVVNGQANKKVIVIDCDLRKPVIHKIFNVSNRKGLTNYLIGEASLEDVIVEAGPPGVSVLTSGPIPPNPAEILGSQRMKDLIDLLKEKFDLVILDTPPILAVTDAQLLATKVDGVLLVLGSGKVLKEHAKKAKGLLELVNANVIGAVLNNKKVDSESYYYYYYGNDN